MPTAAISSTRKHSPTTPLTSRLQIAALMVITPPIQQLDRPCCYLIPRMELMDAQTPASCLVDRFRHAIGRARSSLHSPRHVVGVRAGEMDSPFRLDYPGPDFRQLARGQR